MKALRTSIKSTLAFLRDAASALVVIAAEHIGRARDDEPIDLVPTDPNPRPGGLAAHINRSETPIAEAALLAVYGEYLQDWANEVQALADIELAEMIGGES